MTSKKDSSGHQYLDIENIRVTFIPAEDRKPNKDWADSDVIRIQAYKGEKDNALHMGAEIPIKSPEVFGKCIAAICQIYVEGKKIAATPTHYSNEVG